MNKGPFELSMQDKRAMKRAAYSEQCAHLQGVELRVRVIVQGSKRNAEIFLDTLYPDRKCPIDVVEASAPRACFAGATKDLIVVNGILDQGRIADCWARLRAPREEVDQWGRSLEFIAP